MKKKVIIITFFICMPIIILVSINAYNYYGFSDERPTYPCQHHQDDTLRLTIIGDSWAFYHHKHDSILIQRLSDKVHRPVNINTYGLCGQTSKEVYNSMFEDKALYKILEEGPDFCFVSVGINDTYKKMGARYYVHHTILILHFLLENGIKPIILEIPDYDINYAYEHQTSERKILRQLSMIITNSTLDCREDYRQALRKKLDETDLTRQITFIPNQKWNMCFYLSDRMHLNSKGYVVLDSCLTSIIENFISDEIYENIR